MRILRIITAAVFISAVFISGFSAGMCVKVFIERGVPVVNGGGELVLLIAIPSSIAAGYIIGRRKAEGDKR